MCDKLNPTELAALENMRSAFAGVEGYGLEMSDHTFLRYLRAR